MPLLFGITLFLSAFLLFLVQPMIARMVLPLLGGTAAVWTTCMLFFQAGLLAGYGYAHAATAWLGPRRQVALHVGLVLAALLLLPIDVAKWGPPPAEANPIGWLLGLLLTSVGLPAFVTSSSAPLLQSWFAGVGGSATRDPYRLYAASNLGSLAALLAYPALIEPHLRLASQGWFWTLGYAGLGVLTAACAARVLRSSRAAAHASPKAGAPRARSAPTTTALDESTVRQGLRWIAWAFVPSSLMLGVTTYLTTEVAAAPSCGSSRWPSTS